MAKISTILICLSLLCLLVGSSLGNPAPILFDDLELPELDKRQDNNSTSISSSSSSSSSSSRTTTSRTTSIITPTSTTTSSRTTPTTPATTTTPTITTPTTPTTSSDTTTTTPTSTSTTPRPPAETTSSDPAETTAQSEDVVTASPTTRIVVATIYTTLSGNGVVSSYVTSSTTVETPTGTAASQASGGSNDGGSGLSTSTRNTIIGVVVGVGGALLFGGLAIVAWRLRRKRVNPIDENDLMRRDGSPLAAGMEMHAASPEASPFKTTLDQYHKPPGVNTSSNF